MANQDAVETREQELAEYLQERIKPGLNRGAIPLLARSIAKEIARGEHPDGGSDDHDPDDEPDDELDDEREDESPDEADEESDGASESPVDEFEAEMHELQGELGEDWILRFSVQGGDAWLTAEKQDGSQHVEGPTAEVLLEAVELLDEGGGRSG